MGCKHPKLGYKSPKPDHRTAVTSLVNWVIRQPIRVSLARGPRPASTAAKRTLESNVLQVPFTPKSQVDPMVP